MSSIIKQLCPPVLWNYAGFLKSYLNSVSVKSPLNLDKDHQDLNMYWDEKMAKILDTWGEGNVWSEIQFLMASCNGKVLDIACGTGRVIEILSKFSNIEVYGIDISDFLIGKAIERGILADRLNVGNAISTNYPDNFFKYSYSIGSLEHFTDVGIDQFIAESYRITECISFHMIPVSKSGINEGWMKTYQSFYNNSTDWWMNKFILSYQKVYIIDSSWQDDISLGKWFVCYKDEKRVHE